MAECTCKKCGKKFHVGVKEPIELPNPYVRPKLEWQCECGCINIEDSPGAHTDRSKITGRVVFQNSLSKS